MLDPTEIAKTRGDMTVRFSDYNSIAFRRDGRVLHATFNRPETMNSMNREMQLEVGRLFPDVAKDPETNVLVITGAGRAFSAGGDIEFMQTMVDRPELFLEQIAPGKQLIHSILDCPKPVISKINGPAIGLGATIALFCDLIIAANHAKIADPHVKVGYVAGDGGAAIWPQLIGYVRAKEYLLLGDTLTGEEAARIGLINRAVPAEELDRVVDEFAQRLASGASRAIQWTKLAVNIRLKEVVNAVVDASFAYEALSNLTKDHQEAVNAFRDKRPPKFTGE
jgi:enoyl-CoA hydratase